MKNKRSKKLLFRKNDYDLLLAYLRGQFGKLNFDRQSAEALQAELEKADVVNKDDFPHDVVGLNSRVKVKEDKADRIMEFRLVTPDKADIRQQRISVMAPVGIALIGFRQGQQVSWKVPSGSKTFTILDVDNS